MATPQDHLRLEAIKFERDSAVPYYQQLKQGLTLAFQTQAVAAGVKLPSEREFCEHFGISRLTVRRALNDLTNAGWLFSHPGKGTFVRARKAEQGTYQLMGLSEDMKNKGHSVTSKIIRLGVVTGSRKTTTLMRLEPKAKVFVLERLRYLDGSPLAIERAFLNYRYCPEIAKYDLSASLYNVLGGVFGLKIGRAEQSYEALPAGSRQARLLGLKAHAPVLYSERVTFLDNDDVIEQGSAWYRGDRYKFHTTLLKNTVPPSL